MSEPDFDTGGWQPLPGAAARNPATAREVAVASEFLLLSDALPLYSQKIINGELTDEDWRELAGAWQSLARQCLHCAGAPP